MGTTKLLNQCALNNYLTNEDKIIISQCTSTNYLGSARDPNIKSHRITEVYFKYTVDSLLFGVLHHS